MTLSARNWAWSLERLHDGTRWVLIKPGEKVTLLYLAEMENAVQGFAFPSVETIALKTGQSKRTVITHLATLEQRGAISRGKAAPRRDGKWLRNTYVLHVPEENREGDPEWQREQG
jgi:DNA-binding MarR family transcriptional regulator